MIGNFGEALDRQKEILPRYTEYADPASSRVLRFWFWVSRPRGIRDAGAAYSALLVSLRQTRAVSNKK